jgi:serine/threonine-protein kinase
LELWSWQKPKTENQIKNMLHKGDKINNYTLEKYLGKGSYGEVWLAKKAIELSDDGILVALKFLGYQPNKNRTEDDFIKQVKREVGTWIKASGHKNIVSVQDGFAFRDDTFVIVSDFAEGGSLADWLEMNGGKSPNLEKTVEIMSEILDGLAHLHSQNPDKIIHRDLKPDNVLFKSGVPCITDFGVSRMSQTITQSMAQVAATSAGTPLYMSPESFNNQPASRSMDIWAAGVILYQMLSGEFPYNGDNPISLALEVISGKPPKPLPTDVPQEFQAIVAKVLERDVAKRLQTAEEMKASLKDALKRWEMSQHQPIMETPQPVQPKVMDTIIDEDFKMPIKEEYFPTETQKLKGTEEEKRLQIIESQKTRNDLDGLESRTKGQEKRERLEKESRERNFWIAIGVIGILVSIFLLFLGRR